MRHRRWLGAVLAAISLAGCGGSSSSAAQPMRVLVTNDDGVGAPGIAALVQELGSNPQLAVTISAPATNQSGSGDQTTTGPLRVAPATTSNSFAATAVTGYPADSVLFAVLGPLPAEPDLIVSGINAGQNIGEFTYLSGTVGAARWGARHRIPAIAFSQGLPASSYAAIAAYAGELVERFRRDAEFRRLLVPPDSATARILNVNFPTCASGQQRGIVVVPVGRSSQIFGYNLSSTDGDASIYQPQVESTNVFASNCTSTLTNPGDDVTALTNGFATLTPLTPDLGVDTGLDRYRFLTR